MIDLGEMKYGVYSVFSKDIANSKQGKILGGVNISTPKLTQLFSFIVSIGWSMITFYMFFKHSDLSLLANISLSINYVLIIGLFHFVIIPRNAESLIGNTHTIIEK